MKIHKRTNHKNKLKFYRKQHIRKIIKGTGLVPRLSVFKSLKNIYIQAINDNAGQTIVALNSLSSKIMKSGNKTEISYSIGKIFGDLLIKNGIKKAIFDRNGLKYTGRIAMLAKGIRDSGLYI
jgi:large subunit ribosomal protein L18